MTNSQFNLRQVLFTLACFAIALAILRRPILLFFFTDDSNYFFSALLMPLFDIFWLFNLEHLVPTASNIHDGNSWHTLLFIVGTILGLILSAGIHLFIAYTILVLLPEAYQKLGKQ